MARAFALVFFLFSVAPAQASTVAFHEAAKKIVQWQSHEKSEGVRDEHATLFLHHGKRTAKVVLILHGLQESPLYLKSWAKLFYANGYNVIAPLLPGHARTGKRFANKATFNEWLARSEDALHTAAELGDRVTVFGYSIGGTLGTYLATVEYEPRVIEQLILFAPLFEPSQKLKTAMCQDIDRVKPGCWATRAVGKERDYLVKDGLIDNPKVGLEAGKLLGFIHQELSGSDQPHAHERVADFARVPVPVFMVATEADTFADWQFNRKVFDRISTKKIYVSLEKGKGVLHSQLSKTYDDRFRNSPDGFNPYADQIARELKAALSLR